MDKPAKTPADYLVIAVSPALLIVLVHSVCFFLVEVFYHSDVVSGVRWVLFWFVLAVVLISRIGIEQGTAYALGYGLALAGATWVYLSTIQPNVLFGAILLGIVWFTAHKLTCNCTLVDDDVDASGQGLLQSLQSLPSLLKKLRPAAAADKVPPPQPNQESTGARGFDPKKDLRPQPATPIAQKKKSSSEIPGIWLIYYSLAALPLFGLGQTLLPAGDLAARRMGFVYLFCYLAAALGLMITTSFLGLRRYLRQRYLVMPGNIAFGWIQFGVVAAMIVLCLSLLLPRPGAGQAWGSMRYHIDQQIRRASEYAARFNSHGSGSGRAGNQAPPAGQQDNNPPPPGPASNPNPSDNPGAKSPDGQKPGSGSDQDATSGKSGGHEAGTPGLSPTASSVYPWLRALFWLVAVLALAWLCYRYRTVLLTMLRSAWAAIRDFIAALRGLFQSSATVPGLASKTREVLPFKTFKSPFLTGADRVWPAEQLITYSYDALQSWVLEQEATHGSPKTPREFCRQLADEMPELADALEHLAFLYGHVAYGGSVPGNYNPEHLRQLWHRMAIPRPSRATASVSDKELAARP